jgi:hypothetical protein
MTEAELSQALSTKLEPYFWLIPEVWLRDPLSGASLRVDFVGLPKPTEQQFPLDVIAVEVKRPDTYGKQYIQALKQCIDYKRCVIDDERAKRCRGLTPAAVFLCRGQRDGLYENHVGVVGPDAHFGLVRLAGKFNVGEAALCPKLGVELAISDTRIWTARDGTTGAGEGWLPMRRIGNSTRRVAA